LTVEIGSSAFLDGSIKDLKPKPEIDKVLIFILLGIAIALIIAILFLCISGICWKK